MTYEQAKVIYDETAFKGGVTFAPPHIWSEPLLVHDLDKHIETIKSGQNHISINSNGLLLNKDKAKMILDQGVDSFFISIDAFSTESYKLTRDSDEYELLLDNLHVFINLRNAGGYKTRIGVSFVSSESNRHEITSFRNYWSAYVDVIRINEEYSANSFNTFQNTKRQPCLSIFDNMVINHKGDVIFCCLDEAFQTNLGNVFNDGIESIWNGDLLSQLRNRHLNNSILEKDLCSGCDVWRLFMPYKTIHENGVTINYNDLIKFYNIYEKP